MKLLLNNEDWGLRVLYGDGTVGERVPLTVTGTVYSALLAAGRMEDPFYRDNELEALKLMDNDFEFSVNFDRSEALLPYEKTLLRFEGIDTLGTVTLNGHFLGNTDNMHRVWEFDVTDILQEENTLTVILHSPTEYIKKSYEGKPIEAIADCMRGAPRLRKAHCMFGWDWGARLPDAGLFRDVSLVGINKKRINNVLLIQDHEEGLVTIRPIVYTDPGTPISSQAYDVVTGLSQGDTEKEFILTLTDPDGISTQYDSPECIRVEKPRLWWPNGYGDQPLYSVSIQLKDSDERWEKRIGLRTISMCTEENEYGHDFCHIVNGVKIFAMGTDYIPEDNLLSRVTPERTRRLLEDAAMAHHNIIRVWGGGYYPDDFFFDICDELGLVVWQDFMFACMVYDLTEDFEKNITAELVDNITRLRHHASLGAWCGNNEIETFIAGGKEHWCRDPKEYADYIKMFEYLFPKLAKKLSPQTFYWPSSPSSGGGYDNPWDENRGDMHYWDVWHGNKPITEFRKFHFRYLSEFGFQSFPSLRTVETFTEPEDRNIFSYVMEKHQRNVAANGKIMNYMEQTYLYPTSFDMLLYASQLLQAEAMRYGVEHFRRNRGRCMGAVIWQLNDNWPVASWSSIDYYGRWKALHYFEKRFFAPIMISCDEEGTLTQDPNVNAQPYDVKKSITLNVANETLKDEEVTVEWELRDNTGSILRSDSTRIGVKALSSAWLRKVDLPEAELYSNYVSYRARLEGKVVSEGTILFCAPKFFKFRKPELSLKVNGDEITVGSDVYAKGIRIINEADDLILSDNYFDLNGGEKTLRIIRGSAVGLKVNSVYDIR